MYVLKGGCQILKTEKSWDLFNFQDFWIGTLYGLNQGNQVNNELGEGNKFQ